MRRDLLTLNVLMTKTPVSANLGTLAQSVTCVGLLLYGTKLPQGLNVAVSCCESKL